MIKQLILFLLLIISYSAKADFVDIATLKVNGTLIRKLTNNNLNPYFVNLSRFHVGDTLSIKIWTDHGAEKNAYVSIKNLDNNHKFVLTKENQFIISDELLLKRHLISVTFILDEETQITWDICYLTPNDKIEKVYSSINELRDFILSLSNGKPHFSSTILKDSITTNYRLNYSQTGTFTRTSKDTLNYPITKIHDFLALNQKEKTFIKQIDAIDYVKLYDFTSDIHGSIVTGDEGINTFCFSYGNFHYWIEFHFIYLEDKYILKKIFYTTD